MALRKREADELDNLNWYLDMFSEGYDENRDLAMGSDFIALNQPIIELPEAIKESFSSSRMSAQQYIYAMNLRRVLQLIKGRKNEHVLTFRGENIIRAYSELILRCDTLVLHPGAVVMADFGVVTKEWNFFAIWAKEIIFPAPFKPARVGLTTGYITPNKAPQPSERNPAPDAAGFKPGGRDGNDGPKGEDGRNGIRGYHHYRPWHPRRPSKYWWSVHTPPVYIFTDNIIVDGQPDNAERRYFHIALDGRPGAEGADGGKGGDGGRGASGASGRSGTIDCQEGPGDGGNGGRGGDGGHGGMGGKGGDSGDLFLIAKSNPDPQNLGPLEKLKRSVVYFSESVGGDGGRGGRRGMGGAGGARGARPGFCNSGGKRGSPGDNGTSRTHEYALSGQAGRRGRVVTKTVGGSIEDLLP